jgi:hypothetical protein
MLAFVKTANDEKNWSNAKSIAKNNLGTSSGDKFYAYANAVFHRMQNESEYDNLTEDKVSMYSNFDFLVNNLKEEEIWHVMKHVMFEHKNLNSTLNENDKYNVLEYLFKNYKETINSDDFESISEYVDSMVIPEAKYNDINYGLIDEDYISGGFGGMGSAEYGYGGVGYSGGRSRRRGFGGPRQGGQMSRRATANPNAPSGELEPPISVDIPEKNSNYKPWEVQLTPDGQNVNNIKRHKVQSEIDKEWEGELGSIVRGLELAGLDLDELADMSQEEIQDVMLRKIKQVGKEALDDMEKTSLNESFNEYTPFDTIIQESFGFDVEELDERLRRASRIQDAREILSSKHNFHKAIEKDKNRKYIIDQYGIDKFMRKFGYSYDDNNFEWLKTSNPQKTTDDKKSVSKTSTPAKQTVIPITKYDNSNGDNDLDGSTQSADSNSGETPTNDTSSDTANSDESKDYEIFNSVSDPVTLESRLKPLMGRFILSLIKKDITPTEFSQSKDGKTYIPKISDSVINKMMYELNYDWDGDKDIWVDESNTIPTHVLQTGEDRKSISGRAYLAALGENAAIQFDSSFKPLFSVDEVYYRMDIHDFDWNTDINKWTKDDKDLANSSTQLNESFLLEQNTKKSKVVPAINQIIHRELQARYLYRLAQFDVLNNAPKSQKEKIKFIMEDTNPLLFSQKLLPNEKKIKIEDIEELLTGEAIKEPNKEKNTNTEPSIQESVKNKLLSIFCEKEDYIELSGDTDNDNSTIELSGDTDTNNTDIDNSNKNSEESTDANAKDEVSNISNGKIQPRNTYKWENRMWLENGKLPKIVADAGDDIMSYNGRSVLAVLSRSPKPLEIKDTGKPVINSDRVKSLLDDINNINWYEKANNGNGLWIKGEIPSEVDETEELNEIETKLKNIDLKILKKYNNGQGFDIDTLPISYRELLFNAIIGQYLMQSGIDEKEWYSFPIDDKAGQSKGKQFRNKHINKFKEKHKIMLKKLNDDEKKNPAHTHKVSIENRTTLLSVVRKTALSAIGKILQSAAKNSPKVLAAGMEILARMDGYQGPLVRLSTIFPFIKSGSYQKYEDERREALWGGRLRGKQPDVGSPSKTTKP